MIGKALFTGRFGASIGLVAAIVALAAQPVFAFDGRSPDTKSAAAAAEVAAVSDARSPDTRSTALSVTGTAVQDFRDAVSRSAPVAPVAKAAPASTGFDWGDFGVGVGAAFGSILLLVALGFAFWAGHRRREAGNPALT